jgi:hypothetical protein
LRLAVEGQVPLGEVVPELRVPEAHCLADLGETF